MAAAEEGSSTLATAKVIVSATASFTATLLLARSVTRDLIPDDIQDNFTWAFRKFCSRYFSSKMTIVIQEFEGLEPNKLYEATNNYLATKISPSTTRIRVSRHEKEARHNVSVEPEEEIQDVFDGVDVKWELVVRMVESNQHHSFGGGRRFGKSETRNFELTFHRKHKDTVIDRYLPYIEERAKELRQEKKTLKLFTLSMDFYDLSEIWTSVNLDHPSTFDTLAMDIGLKETVLEDLKRFLRRKDYYRRVGKAWKRGYLLYGPPGTGKSSLIAAMANYLKFDVYDLELTAVERNLELRKALVATANRSILVIEDIDCTIDLSDRSAAEEETTEPHKSQEKKVSLMIQSTFY
ncbi:hypothetical protein MLD38_030860 [Melastoma candidum]|uniref:Uncharacterized protein n=1 Tax=Melastoma candidum TaxID=119954 RepID=A0ACB9MMT5_9MYRT|nr:hypothetical protein MLD38_030860 [Melastoma candidum]